MYVCQCRAVTDRQIRGAVAEGCTTIRSVSAVTGAGGGCGTCVPTIRDLVCRTCPSQVVALSCDDAVTPSPSGASAVANEPGVAPAPQVCDTV